jgi:hypothetical protein
MVSTVMPNVPVSKTRPGRRYDNLFVSGVDGRAVGEDRECSDPFAGA